MVSGLESGPFPSRKVTNSRLPAAASGVGVSQSPRVSGIAMEEPALAENESRKFLNYARRQAAAMPSGQPLYFSDIVPERTTAPPVAAQALYHLLGLAMKGMVKVDQPVAYGEVRCLYSREAWPPTRSPGDTLTVGNADRGRTELNDEVATDVGALHAERWYSLTRSSQRVRSLHPRCPTQ